MTPASEDVFGQLATMRVVPVVVLDDSAAAAPLADAGLPCAEITLRTAAGEAAISIMAQQRNLLVGAGTVLDASPVSFDDLIERADYLAIQAPLTKRTVQHLPVVNDLRSEVRLAGPDPSWRRL